MKKRLIKIIGGVVGVLVLLIVIFSQIKGLLPISMGWHNKVMTSSNRAIYGYDPVAYFERGKAIKGNADIAVDHDGSTWYFATQEAKEMFGAEPNQYVPQFGGYCSLAVSKGFTANPNPEVFAVVDNKLYLFADYDVKKDWLSGIEDNLKLSSSNWNK